nr:MFS transporter [uncultured Microbacterium sp.]
MSAAQPLWRGRALALIGIVLVAFSLRSAVASLSPVIDHVSEEFPVSSVVVGLIGAAPPVCFAVFGLLTPLFERRFGLERVAVVAIGLIAAGLLLRGLAVDSTSLLAATAVVFAGVGSGNVLLPPLVKKYFPDRLGLMMTVYSTTMAVSTFVPPLVAVPIADTAGWRVSLGLWGVFAAIALVPWIAMLVTNRTDAVSTAPTTTAGRGPESPSEADADYDAASVATGPISTSPANPRVFGRLWRIPMAWAVALVFAASSTLAYVSFAWLPAILIDVGGASPADAGLLLSLFGLMGMPCSLLVPILIVRFQATRPVFFIAIVCGLVGLSGLLFAPGAGLPLWVAIYGLAPALFPLALVLLSIRARTPESAVALSGFVQSIGYAVAAAFPLLIGLVHEATGSWEIPLLVLAGVLIAVIPAGWIAGRRRTIEEDWERRHGRW